MLPGTRQFGKPYQYGKFATQFSLFWLCLSGNGLRVGPIMFYITVFSHKNKVVRRFNHQIEEQRTRTVFIIAFYASAIVMLSICFYALHISAGEYLRNNRLVIGEILVKTEFPVQGFPKLVTYLMIASVVSWFCVTKLAGERVNVIPESLKSLCQLFILAIAVITLYEFVYNSVLWNSFLTIEVISGDFRLEGISVPYPNPETPWNLIFATKMTLAAFLISSHAFYIISKSKRFRQDPTKQH